VLSLTIEHQAAESLLSEDMHILRLRTAKKLLKSHYHIQNLTQPTPKAQAQREHIATLVSQRLLH